MKKYLFTLSIGFVGATHREIVEFEDDFSVEEVEQEWQQWCWEKIDGQCHEATEDEVRRFE